ncbi:NUDIX domain-containing protein [soil metagenome]
MRPDDGERPGVEAGVAAVVLDERGHVLLHRRHDEDWSPPSGTVPGGESLADTLVRELREETCLDTRVERLVGVYSDPRYQVTRTADGQLTHFITCFFGCRRVGGDLQGSDEAVAWDWFAPDRLPKVTAFARAYLDDAFNGNDIVVR